MTYFPCGRLGGEVRPGPVPGAEVGLPTRCPQPDARHEGGREGMVGDHGGEGGVSTFADLDPRVLSSLTATAPGIPPHRDHAYRRPDYPADISFPFPMRSRR